jgi:hypothetical protein
MYRNDPSSWATRENGAPLKAAGVGMIWRPPACRTFAASGTTRRPGLLSFLVVSIKQRYPVPCPASWVGGNGVSRRRCLGRYTVVVDDDIDPTNLDEVCGRSARVRTR